MPKSLSGWFLIAASALTMDMFVFGALGLEAQIGHGSMWSPHEPMLKP